VRIDPTTWTPLGFSQPLCGELEIWAYSTWQRWGGRDGVAYPRSVLHQAYAGGTHAYRTLDCSMVRAGESMVQCYAIPPCPKLPEDTEFDASVSSAVQVSGG